MKMLYLVAVALIIGIIGTIIYIYTYKSKESLFGVPHGYTNLLISDPDGNKSTFSIGSLENDIKSKVGPEVSRQLDAYRYTKQQIDQMFEDKIEDHINYGDAFHLVTLSGDRAHVYSAGRNVGYAGDMNWYGSGTKENPDKSTGFMIEKAPKWDGGSGAVWKN